MVRRLIVVAALTLLASCSSGTRDPVRETVNGVACPQAARATFKVGMSGKPRAISGLEGLLPRTSGWRFELRLELEKGTWKITSASRRRLEESG